MRCRPCTRSMASGFSLVEIIVVIMVASIMAIGVVDFISNSSEGYVRTANRNQVSAAGRVVVDRIAMELRNALPYSVRTTSPADNGYGSANDQCIEFIPVQAASTYLNPRFRPAAASADPFDVVAFVPDQIGASGRYAVIYPTSESDLYKDSYSSTEAIVALSAIAAHPSDDGKVQLTPAAAHRFLRRSPVERIFITTQPVSYCVSGTRLHRYADYGFFEEQPIPFEPDGSTCNADNCLALATPTRALVTDQVANTAPGFRAFDYLAASRRRNGVIQIQLNFSQGGETVLLNHEVMQQSTP